MKKYLLSTAVLSLLFVTPALAGDHSHGSWGYTGDGAAANWGDLKDDYHTCKDGKKQSPINIDKFVQGEVPPLQLNYQDTPLVVVNNGHTVQVNYAPGSSVSVGGKTYNLLQFHFHTPSEHYLNGAPAAMEVHFVHKAEDGTLGVVGVMMKVGAENAAIKNIWENIPAAGEEKAVEGVTLAATQLLPGDHSYLKYEGSLTTPPCSEGVQWHVLKKPIEISQEQLIAFQELFPVNARPVQPLHGRVAEGE